MSSSWGLSTLANGCECRFIKPLSCLTCKVRSEGCDLYSLHRSGPPNQLGPASDALYSSAHILVRERPLTSRDSIRPFGRMKSHDENEKIKPSIRASTTYMLICCCMASFSVGPTLSLVITMLSELPMLISNSQDTFAYAVLPPILPFVLPSRAQVPADQGLHTYTHECKKWRNGNLSQCNDGWRSYLL
jgi:hypothetical protein